MKKNKAFSKILSLALVMALMLTTIMSAFSVTASAEESVIANKYYTNFEEGVLPDGQSATSDFAITDEVAWGGYSLKHTGRASGVSNYNITNLGLKSGTTYIISGYLYVVDPDVTGASTYSWFSVWELNGQNEIGTVGNKSSGVWHKFEIEYNCTLDDATIRFNAAKSTCYFDNIHVYEKGAYDKLPLTTDFSDAETASTVPVLPGVTTSTVNYEYNAELGKNVLVGTVSASNSGWTSEFQIPYTLKAGVTYNLKVKYTSDIWMACSFNGMQEHFANYDVVSNWKVLDAEFTPTADGQTIKLYSDNNNNTGRVCFDYIVLKEVAENTNTASKQVYDFDNVDFSANTLTANISTLAIVGDTFARDFSVPGSKTESNFKLDFALTAGKVYKLSYDYKGAGAVRFIPNNGSWGQSMYSVEQEFDNYQNNLTLAAAEDWTTHTTVFTAADSSTYLWIANFTAGSTLYFDNITIEDVSDEYDLNNYVNDFEDEGDRWLIEKAPSFTDVTYETDEKYGTVAKISYSGTSANGIRRVSVPIFNLLAGEKYRIKVTYKSNGWIANTFETNTLISDHGYGAPNVTMEDWKEQYFYYTPETACSFGFGTNQADVTIWIAEIAIEKVSGVLGDLDNTGVVDSADLVVIRQWLMGKIGGYNMFDYAIDITEDGSKNLKDLVRMKRILAGVGAPTTVIVDECANDVELYSSASNIYKNDNNPLFADTTRYRVHTTGTESNIIYYAELGLNEAAIGYDKGEAVDAEMTVYVSEDQTDWTEVTADTVSTKPDNDGSWLAATNYYSNLSGKYLKIVLPDNQSFAINKVYINGLDSAALSAAGAQNEELRNAATIYVSNDGNDSNDGLTPDTALATLSAATSMALVPGDTIALACGDTFEGRAVLTASGTADAPIKITSYGEGEKPVITDFAGTNIVNGTGLLITGNYVEVSNLAFTDKAGYSALDFYAYEAGETKGLKVENCKFYDINHTDAAVRDETGAIHFVAKGANPTWFDGVTVQNNEFESVARTAVLFSSEWIAIDKSQGWGNRNLALEGQDPYLAKNVKVSNNKVNNNGGDAILLIGVEGAVAEYNIVSNSHLLTELSGEKAFAAIWCHSSVGCVIQYNEVYGITSENGGRDLWAYDIDHACTDCVVQYNYSHENEGGAVLVCGTDGENDSMVQNSIIRYNVSVNDGLGENRSALDFSAGIDGVVVHNNTIIAKDTDRFFTIADYCKDDVYVAPQNIKFYNNLFYGANSDTSAITYGGDWHIANDITVEFYNNVFRSVDNLPWDAKYATLWASPVYADNITTTDTLLKGIDSFISNTTITNGLASVYDTATPITGTVLLNGGYDMSTVYDDFVAVDYAGNQYSGNIIGAMNNGDVVVYHDILTTGETGALECTYSVNSALHQSILGTAGSYCLTTADGKHVTWEQANMQSFWLDGFISESGKSSINDYYILQASSDNATWSDLTYTVTYSAGGSYQRCRLMVDNLPEGTKYVKLTKADGYGAWNKGSFVGVGYTYSK